MIKYGIPEHLADRIAHDIHRANLKPVLAEIKKITPSPFEELCAQYPKFEDLYNSRPDKIFVKIETHVDLDINVQTLLVYINLDFGHSILYNYEEVCYSSREFFIEIKKNDVIRYISKKDDVTIKDPPYNNKILDFYNNFDIKFLKYDSQIWPGHKFVIDWIFQNLYALMDIV